ncbi:MAG: ImmA/IrrE family metallo-endopeptidase [Clostridia bacterium]|nr:ImmA/IrrE family metallo-endopeptidase [Clostridia bacterium]
MRRVELRRSELCAVELLCRQGFSSIYDFLSCPITRLKLPVTTVFDSFAAFCNKTGASRADFDGGTDALTVRHGGEYVILYNEAVENERRRAFTLAHEVGHVLLSHAGEEPEVEEREANAFAASLLCPEILFRYLEHREGISFDEEKMTEYFSLSREAAANRLRDLRRRAPRQPADSEITLLLCLFGKIAEKTPSL